MSTPNRTYQELLQEISTLKAQLGTRENVAAFPSFFPSYAGTRTDRSAAGSRADCTYPAEQDLIVLHVDAAGTVRFINELGEKLFGYTLGELQELPLQQTLLKGIGLPPSPHAGLEGMLRGELEHRLRDGGCAWVQWSCRAFHDGRGRRDGTLYTGTDVTEHKYIREQTARYMSDLAYLSHSAMYFVEHASDKDLYKFIAEQLHLLVGDSVIIVNAYEPEKNLFHIRSVACGAAELKTLEEIFGASPAALAFPCAGSAPRAVSRGTLATPQSLHELFGLLPEVLYRRLDGFLQGARYGISFVFQGNVLGNVAIFTPPDSPLPNPKLIEAFINQASVALRRKRAEEEIKRSAEEWRSTFDSISDLIVILDVNMRVLRVNKAFARTFSMEPSMIIGMPCSEVMHDTTFPVLESLAKQVQKNRRSASREHFDRRTGLHVEITATPVFDGKREIIRTIHIIKDITERKQAEEILRRDKETLKAMVQAKTEELLGAQKELENARRLSDIGVLAATIAHEIRNPLAAIKTAAYNIRRKSQNPTLDGHLATIDKKVLESDQIIRNLLSYSRIKLPNYEWFLVGDMLRDTFNAVAEKYCRWEAKPELDLRVPADDLIEADPIHLRVLFTNLLDNAFQSLPERTGMVRMEAVKTGDSGIEVRVADTGTGIDKEDLQRITEPFFTRKSKGIGLGLTIAVQIVNLHNGRITIDSEKGRGTTVKVQLPLKRKAPAAQ